MKFALLLTLFMTASVLAKDPLPSEPSCRVIAHDSAGSTHVIEMPTLHVLAQTSSSPHFALPADSPANVTSIMCVRSSPVPAVNDYKVLLAGFPLLIATGPKVAGGPNRIVRLEIEKGQLHVNYDRDILTVDEEQAMQHRLNEMQLAMQASP